MNNDKKYKTILAELKLTDADTNISAYSPHDGALPQFGDNHTEIKIMAESDEEIIRKLFMHVLSIYCKLENDEKLCENLQRRWSIFCEKSFEKNARQPNSR
jgi:hypothetical protein